MSEKDWAAGYQAAMTRIVGEALRHLPDSDKGKAMLLIERQGAIVALREVCAAFGDNDWSDELELADIIEKHLHRHLSRKEAASE